MKALLRISFLTALFAMVMSTQVHAQAKGKDSGKRTENTKAPNKQVTSDHRSVPSKNVTYKKPNRKVVSVRNLPNREVIIHKGQNYYYANNRYYTYSKGHYIMIPPKVGFRIRTLPPDYKRIQYNSEVYFVSQGTFYVHFVDEYVVVDPEVGTIVYELPDDYEKVEIDGETYYEYANVLYEKVQIDGARAYEVVGIIEME